MIPLMDSASSNIMSKLSWANLKTSLGSIFAKFLGDADFYQYSIVRSVGNLVVNNSFETDLSGWSTY